LRLAAQAKLGWYPAAPEAVAELIKHLRVRPPDPDKTLDTANIIDPCAGEGRAIRQIAEALAVEPGHTYAVELDARRAEAARANLSGCIVLGPASFLGVQITAQSFGLAYVNPPFDDEMGGGRREEQAFVERATRLLVPRGVLVMVCPLKALAGNREFCGFLDAHYDEVCVYKFPDGHRPYNEIVVIGKKRRETIPSDAVYRHGCLQRMGLTWGGFATNGGMDRLPSLGDRQPLTWQNGYSSTELEPSIRTWEIPPSWKPSTFKKTAFTDDELDAAIATSPLSKLLREVAIPPPNAPPLPLDRGHLGLILASGMLDGVVEGPHGVHVVRGSSHKVEYHNREASSSDENPETGAVTTRDVFSQRMVTVIRCVEQNGVIVTFSNQPKEETEDDADERD
jgi:predicted RNA methylase